MALTFTWDQGLLHAIPLLTTILELAMTDLALEKSHWKIVSFVLCPCYMISHFITSYLIRDTGSVYLVENWNTHPVYTFIGFIVIALVQGGIYYCLCNIL